jgi:hypothetical protein
VFAESAEPAEGLLVQAAGPPLEEKSGGLRGQDLSLDARFRRKSRAAAHGRLPVQRSAASCKGNRNLFAGRGLHLDSREINEHGC